MASALTPTDRPTLDKLVRLVRLRDMKNGIKVGEGNPKPLWDGLSEAYKKTWELATAFGNFAISKNKSRLDKIDASASLVAYLDGMLKWWESISTQKLEYCQKFVDVLREMKLDITEETKLIKRIREDNEAAIQTFAKEISKLKQSKDGKGFNIKQTDGLRNVEKKINDLEKDLDNRTRDAISLLSRTLSDAVSQELYELFTKEP